MEKQEKISEFNFQGLKLILYWQGRTDKRGKCQMEYELFLNDQLIGEGNDFCLGAGQYPDTIDAPTSLLGFLTVQKGDTDDDYFKNHSQEHLKFTESNLCEDLRTYLYDYEGGEDSEHYKDAKKFFEDHTTI